jgi:membrane-associated protease RseP (regulator of RpoE activity)
VRVTYQVNEPFVVTPGAIHMRNDFESPVKSRRRLFLPADKPWLNALLFFTTLLTSFEAGRRLADPSGGSQLGQALGFGAAVMAILTAHEMGHYVLSRLHGVDSSLPYFIPLPPPLGLFGTMGAVIRIRSRVPDKNALIDIGAAGPLAGLAVAIPLLALGTSWSRIGPAPTIADGFPGTNSVWSLVGELYWLLREWLFHIPSPELAGTHIVTLFGDNLLSWGMTRLIHGPLPVGHDLYVHPLFLAAWFGLLMTMLNLMPIGQLDGGHLTHALFGDRAVTIGKAVAWLMAFFAVFFSASWLVWLFITAKLIGFRHPDVVFPQSPVSLGRKLTSAISFLFLLLCLMPSPISQAVT